jgi:hypothetical protein
MEQARRSAMAHHVHRIAPMGARVLISETWYNIALVRGSFKTAGVDFVADLNSQVAACCVFLAVIGPNWLDVQGRERRAPGRRSG